MRFCTKTGVKLAVAIAAAFLVYNVGAGCLIRFDLDFILFAHVSRHTDSSVPVAVRVTDTSGDELLIHRYGQARMGCAIFFPGRHGELPGYREALFPKLVAAGMAVFAVDYPGQDGAAGSATAQRVLEFSHHAVLDVARLCGQQKTVILGRSLGAMVAVYAAAGIEPAGIVLDSAAPSLSAAITAGIHDHWYLAPLVFLPIHALLRHDYSLAEALTRLRNTQVVVFQGTADRRTPVLDLERPGALPTGVRLVPIPRATHENAYRMALDAYVATASTLLAPALRAQGR